MVESEQYQNRIATVVGGRGQLGIRIVKGFESLGFGQVRVCEQGDPFRDFVQTSTDLFFATDAKTVRDKLVANRDVLQASQTILDGTSVKTPSLITIYRELDRVGISVASTHLGAVPKQSWRGIKVWICEIGPNSNPAKRLAFDLFLSREAFIETIHIEDHIKIEQDQWLSHAIMYVFNSALINGEITLGEFNRFATLHSELVALASGRTLGQGATVPSEILHTQPRKEEFFQFLAEALEELKQVLDNPERLKRFMQRNIDFHNHPAGFVKETFNKAGRVGATLANLRMHSLSFRITDDRPGKLRELLGPFDKEGVNLRAIHTGDGNITPEEEQLGIDPDRIVDFDIGIDPKTIDPKKEQRIKERLRAMGCTIN